MTDTTDKIYNPFDVANLLTIKESTLRKYSLLLEKAGYVFHKNTQGQRGYTDSDIIVIRRLIDLKNGDMSLERASYAVVTWAKHQGITDDDIGLQRYNEQDISDLKEVVQQQTAIIDELIKRMDKQQQYIDDRLNRHDEILMKSLNESLETRRLLAAAKEKRSFFGRLFRK